jgi:hypothetical protein
MFLGCNRKTMGQSLKRERIQEHEDINQKIQEEKSKLRRRLQFSNNENKEIQDRTLSHCEFLMGIIQEFQLELQSKDVILAKFHNSEEAEKNEESTMQSRPSYD